MGKAGKSIMVQVWAPVMEAINRDFKALNLKRAGYLNALFAREIEALATEVTFRNSDAVRARLQAQKLPNRIKLTLDLDPALVRRIDEVLKDRNIPRDSFVNRVLYFLVAKEVHLRHMGVCFDPVAAASAKPLQDVHLFLYDPFAHIRSANEDRFYTLACFQDRAFAEGLPSLFSLNVAISEGDWKLMANASAGLISALGFDIRSGQQSAEVRHAN